MSRGPGVLDGVRAFVFDVFGTVVDWRGGVAREAEPFLARHKAGEVDAGDFADKWRKRYQPAMEEVRSLRRPWVRLDVLHRENLTAVLLDLGIDADRVPAAELDELNLAWHRLDPWPDSVAAIARLKQRYVVAPLSNGNIALMVDMAKRAELAWDVILGAEIARAYKPAPEAYLRSAEALCMQPGELCMVAAHESDLAAARACGLRTCFIPRPLEHGPGKAPAAGTGVWDVTIERLDQLADMLGV